MTIPASSRGSVLVAVLVLVAFGVLLLTRLIESGNADLLLAMRQADRDRLRADAYGALETTLAVLVDFRTVDGNLYAPAQGWGDPLACAGYTPREGLTLDVGFEDESGRVSLPAASLETLAKLLVQAGIGSGDAPRVADGLYGWMHREHVVTYLSPGARAESAAPPFRGLRSFEELAHVTEAARFFYGPDGAPTPALAAFQRLVSLYRFGQTNLNAAPPAVLVASGWTELQARTLDERRARETKGRGFLRSAEEAGAPAGGWGTSVQLLRINVTARQGAAHLLLSALVTWDGLASLPPPMERKQAGTILPMENSSAPAPPLGTKTSPGALQYPFTILELSESTQPVKPESHEPAA